MHWLDGSHALVGWLTCIGWMARLHWLGADKIANTCNVKFFPLANKPERTIKKFTVRTTCSGCSCMIGHPNNLCAVDVHVCLAILITFVQWMFMYVWPS